MAANKEGIVKLVTDSEHLKLSPSRKLQEMVCNTWLRILPPRGTGAGVCILWFLRAIPEGSISVFQLSLPPAVQLPFRIIGMAKEVGFSQLSSTNQGPAMGLWVGSNSFSHYGYPIMMGDMINVGEVTSMSTKPILLYMNSSFNFKDLVQEDLRNHGISS